MGENRQNRTSAVILSAGKSRRMGSPKLLLPFDANQTFVEHIVEMFRKAGVSDIVVVTNPSDRIEISTANFELGKNTGFTENEDWRSGRISSIKKGLKEISAKANYCFIHNVDIPNICPELISSLGKARLEADYIVPKTDNHGGHPILINKKLMQVIKAETEDDANLRLILSPYKKKYIATECSGISQNINTPEDYSEFKVK